MLITYLTAPGWCWSLPSFPSLSLYKWMAILCQATFHLWSDWIPPGVWIEDTILAVKTRCCSACWLWLESRGEERALPVSGVSFPTARDVPTSRGGDSRARTLLVITPGGRAQQLPHPHPPSREKLFTSQTHQLYHQNINHYSDWVLICSNYSSKTFYPLLRKKELSVCRCDCCSLWDLSTSQPSTSFSCWQLE